MRPARLIAPFQYGALLCLLSVAVLLVGCGGSGQASADSSVASCLDDLETPGSAVTGVFVEPDDGYAPVLDELMRAQCAIDVTIYMLTDDAIFEALGAAEERGVRVRVILDEHPFGMFGSQQEAMDRLKDAGIDVQWGLTDFQFTHAKFFVIDQQVTLVMNQNLTYSAFNGNREFGVVTTDSDVVTQAQEIFDADWSGDGDSAPTGPLLVSPVDSRSRITRMIGEADSSVDFYAEVIRDSGIIGALRDAIQRGVHVRLIINASVAPDNADVLAELATIGVEVRMMELIYIHAKTMIVDGESALIGSQNYTMTSLDRNREVGLVVNDPALVSRVISVFERDWVRSIPGSVVPGDPGGTSRAPSTFDTNGRRMVIVPLDNVRMVRI